MILEEETYEKFGYYPGDLKPHSDKLVLMACDDCGKIRTLRKNQYSAFCRSCATKGERNYGWKGGKVKCICEYCETIFEVFPCFIRLGGGKYCSCSCNSKALRQKSHPEKTRPEVIFETICKKYNLPFKYTGDGAFWIGKKGKKQLNPDFIEANGKKICVEIMGLWWHSRLLNKNLREDALQPFREKHYKKYKWVPIFIWDTDLLREDVEQFVLNEMQKQGVL